MSDATAAGDTNTSPGTTIRPEEAAHFAALAKDWWDPKGSSAMLHRLNPVRLRFIRDAIDLHWGGDPENVRPLAGKTALDVGCGAGLLCEPLARLGADVTGVDAAAENIAVAAEHARGAGLLSPLSPLPTAEGLGVGGAPSTEGTNPHSTLTRTGEGSIRYMTGELAALDTGAFDLVTCLEVLEHVADKRAFLGQLASRVAAEGLLILSTPNRTAASRLLMVGAAEALGLIPRGTHHWDDFVTPDELRALLAEAGLAMGTPSGIAFSPMKGLHLSNDMSLNYIVTAKAKAAVG